MIILFVINIILLSLGLFLIYQANNIKFQRTDQINIFQKQIEQKQKNFQQLKKEYQTYQTLINEQTTQVNFLLNQKNTLNKNIEQAKVQLSQIKDTYQAAAAAYLKEKEDQEKRNFYQIQISKQQISDIIKLNEWKQNLYDPSIVSKIIWSSYIMKPTSNLCNRVIGSSVVCGIYKITNQLTKEIYVGQSVNISDRFKQHIKCGLGIDAAATNKLYNNMQQYGVWNFTFEILQKCTRDKLNEKERFWIEMYQSNKIGLNTQGGTKK